MRTRRVACTQPDLASLAHQAGAESKSGGKRGTMQRRTGSPLVPLPTPQVCAAKTNERKQILECYCSQVDHNFPAVDHRCCDIRVRCCTLRQSLREVLHGSGVAASLASSSEQPADAARED